jgi:hypothetical protein
MAVEVEEVLATWREAERALEALPAESSERPVIQIQVARLRRYYAQLTNETAPASWRLLEAAHQAIEETRVILAEAEMRLSEPSQPTLSDTERLMETWLLAEQALNRAGEDAARRTQLLQVADDARERYQSAIDEFEPGLEN